MNQRHSAQAQTVHTKSAAGQSVKKIPELLVSLCFITWFSYISSDSMLSSKRWQYHWESADSNPSLLTIKPVGRRKKETQLYVLFYPLQINPKLLLSCTQGFEQGRKLWYKMGLNFVKDKLCSKPVNSNKFVTLFPVRKRTIASPI